LIIDKQKESAINYLQNTHLCDIIALWSNRKCFFGHFAQIKGGKSIDFQVGWCAS
jgi:hypothetical protein